jgi:pyridoxamine 5'-phosphate oxidase
MKQASVEVVERRLRESDASPDPFKQFKDWYDEAIAQSNVTLPNAMTLATATADGEPCARVVLLKQYDSDGFVFYTNFKSRKGKELAGNPRACLLFYWGDLERQIRIEGRISKIDQTEAEEYFQTRPRGSQIGALASTQSEAIPSRESLEAKVAELELQFEGKQVPCPSYWGGYRVAPEVFEFWQGRPSRLHDRLMYTLKKDGSWKIERLAP